MAGRKRMLLVLLTLALCILADQATKFAVKSALSKTKPRIVAAGLLKLDYSLNKGGVLAFEWLLPEGWRGRAVTVGISLLLGLTVLVLLTAPGLKTRTAVTLAIFCGGAISNLFDRCAYGAVVDFLNFGITGLRPYIFNVADLEIAIGGVFFLYIIARNIVRISFSRNHSE